MLNYKEAVEEFGIDIANCMLEEEYNQFIRGYGYISIRRKKENEKQLFIIFDEDKYEELY